MWVFYLEEVMGKRNMFVTELAEQLCWWSPTTFTVPGLKRLKHLMPLLKSSHVSAEQRGGGEMFELVEKDSVFIFHHERGTCCSAVASLASDS